MTKAYIKKLKTPYLQHYKWTLILEDGENKVCLVYTNYAFAKAQFLMNESLVQRYLSGFIPNETLKQTEAVLKLI